MSSEDDDWRQIEAAAWWLRTFALAAAALGILAAGRALWGRWS